MYDTPKSNTLSSESEQEEPHSGIGVASFVISVITFLTTIAVIVYAGYLELSTPGGADENAIETMMVGLAIILCGLLLILSFILGLIGLFQNKRRKLFSILGVCVSGGAIGIVIAVVWLGVAYGN